MPPEPYTHLTVREMAALYIRLGWRVVPLDPGSRLPV